MTVSVFLSYDATADPEIARRLARDLRDLGVCVWMAPDSIEPGESFPSAINRGLTSSSVFVPVVSPSALGSKWVRAEIDAAIDLEKKGHVRIIPVVLKRTALPPLLGSYQSLSLSDDYATFFRNLTTALGMAGPATAVGVVSHREADDRGLTSPPADSFVGLVLDGLRRNQDRHDFLIHESPESAEPSSVVLAVAERELLRVGLAVFARDEAESRVVSMGCEELHTNPHQVNGILIAQPGDPTSTRMYQVLDRGSERRVRPWTHADPDPKDPPRIAHVLWNPDDDDSAMASMLALFFELLRGRPFLPELEMDPFVDAALSEIDREARKWNARVSEPPQGHGTILRRLVETDATRIGVAVWGLSGENVSTILAEMRREQERENKAVAVPVDAYLGIHPGAANSLQPYDLTRTGSANAHLLTWEMRSGSGAIRAGLARLLGDSNG